MREALVARVHRWQWMYPAIVFCTAMATSSLAQNTFTTLAKFDWGNGGFPQEMVLVQGTDGNLYGATYGGRITTCSYLEVYDGCGTIFKMTPSGMLTTLYYFCSQTGCPDGSNPQGALIVGENGNFYGTATFGGANDGGTFFKITP